MTEARGLLIYGAGGHGRVVVDAALSCGFEVRGVVDDDRARWGTSIHDVPVIGGREVLGDYAVDEYVVVLAVGDGDARSRLSDVLEGTGRRFATVVHPSAVLGRGSSLGEGTVILPAAVVHTDAKVGRHVIINTAATVDHDCLVGDFAHISPGAHLAGGVQIRRGAHIGVGASVAPGVVVGRDAIVGAGAVVINDVPAGTIVAGVPARLIEEVVDGR